MFISQTTDSHFAIANYRFSFRKLQIFISQTTDSHFAIANYRFSFRKLRIFISQTTDFHFVSQTTVSQNYVIPNEPSNHNLNKKRLQKRHRTFRRHREPSGIPRTLPRLSNKRRKVREFALFTNVCFRAHHHLQKCFVFF